MMGKSKDEYARAKAKRRYRRAVSILLALAVVIAAAVYLWKLDAENARARLLQRYRVVTADQGDVVVTISGDGRISSAGMVDLITPATGTLKEFSVQEGDVVRSGQTLGKIEKDTRSIEREIEQLENTLEQLKQQKKNTQAAYSERVIKSPVDGRVKDVRATVDEDAAVTIRTHGYLATISPNGRMEAQIVTDSLIPAVGTPVWVVRDETGEKISGTVIKSLAQPEENGQPVQDKQMLGRSGGIFVVQIDRDDLPVGAPVSIYMQETDQPLGGGALAVQGAVMVQGAGTISGILKGENQQISRGEALFRVASEDISRAVVSQQLQIDQVSRQLEDRIQQLSTAEEIVYAPAGGVFTQATAREGMDVAINRVLGTIVSNDRLEAVVAVDELDILKLRLGQRVTILADAMPNQPFGGSVKDIAMLGTVGQNRTTYDVTVSLTPPEQLRIGMSVHVDIDVEQARQTICLPVEALRETSGGTAVLMATLLEDPDAALRSELAQIPQEVLLRHLRPVTVGLINARYAQIRSGIAPDEAVLVDMSVSNLFDLFLESLPAGQKSPAVAEGGQ